MSPAPSTTAIVGSIRSLMDAFTAAQATILDSPYVEGLEPLTLYRWRETQMDAPALWNQLLPETSAQHDTSRRMDSFFVETRIGFSPGDSDDWWDAVETYADVYRAVMDPIFRREVAGSVGTPLFGGAARWAERQSMATFGEEVGSTPFQGIAFVQRFDADRIVLPGT